MLRHSKNKHQAEDGPAATDLIVTGLLEAIAQWVCRMIETDVLPIGVVEGHQELL